jgi:hypothetical protein
LTQVELYSIRKGVKWNADKNSHWRRAIGHCRAAYHIVVAMYAVCVLPPLFPCSPRQVYCIVVDSQALPPPVDVAQRWDLLMKPFAKVKAPQVPSWSTAKLVLSPTKRPMLGAEADTELDPIERLNKYSDLVKTRLARTEYELRLMAELNKTTPILYAISDKEIEGDVDLVENGMSLPVVSRFITDDHA